MKNKLAELSSYGKLMLLIGLLLLLPLLVIPFFPQDAIYAPAFLIPALSSLLLGFLVSLLAKQDDTVARDNSTRQYSLQRSSLVVFFAWSWGIIVGALPFSLADKLSPLQALFESVSGWTTTGLSVMDVSQTPAIFLFHRSFMQYCGGLGFVLMMIILVLGKQSMNLFNAEGHPDKLKPNLRQTAQTIFLMYNSFLLLGVMAYTGAGMAVFDALLHSMCALSTGGFSSKLNSIGEYGQVGIELITIVLMLIGTTNFAVLQLVSKGKWRQISRVSEIRFLAALLLLFIPLTAFSLQSQLGLNFSSALRHASFDLVSALSTTGYSSMSYNAWPPFALGLIILLMLIGGGIGSTAGGIKLSRSYLILRLALLNLQKRLAPQRKVHAPFYMKAQGKAALDHNLAADTTGFVVSYLLIFSTGSLLLTLTADCSLTEALFEFASALGTVGLSLGITNAASSSGTLLVEICGMMLGRLEIFIIILALHSGASRLRRHLGPPVK